MSENQVTKTSPAGKEVVFKTTITQRDRMKLSRVVKDGMKVDIQMGDLPPGVDRAKLRPEELPDVKPTIHDINLADLDEGKQKATIEVMAVSYDGKPNVYEILLDLDPKEFDFVLETADELLQKVSF